MSGVEAVLAKAWFDRQQSTRRDDGRKRPDGALWCWDDLTTDDRRAYLSLTAPLAEAVTAHLREWLAGEAVREVVVRAIHGNTIGDPAKGEPIVIRDRWAEEILRDATAALDAVAGLLGGES